MSTSSRNTVTRGEWDAARARRIFFGHQSIGENILDGVAQIASAERWPAVTIVEGTAVPPGASALVHAKIGENGDPASKINGFRQALEAGAGSTADVAVMKFCFWDVRRDTDVDAVFNQYRQTIDDLGRRFPNVTFVHATVPLVVEDRDWRAKVRRLLSMGVPTDADNATRDRLNRRIRETYGASGLVFDIAALEGAAGGGSIPALAEEWSSDGAHLNAAGRREVAAGFVKVLAMAGAQRPAGGVR